MLVDLVMFFYENKINEMNEMNEKKLSQATVNWILKRSGHDFFPDYYWILKHSGH